MQTFLPIERSSMITGLSYDDETNALDVHFATTGGVYRYLNVPADVFEQLSTASSVGRAFIDLVKNRFAWQQIQ